METSDPFRTSMSGAGSTIADTANDLKDKAADLASDAREKVSELGTNTADAIDKGLHSAGDKLQATADSLRNTGATGSSRLTDISHTAASKLEATARYFQDYDTRDLMGQIEQTVRRNPGPSMIAAAAVGFLIGTALRNRD